MMKNKITLRGRGWNHTLTKVQEGKYSLQSDYVRVIYDNDSPKIFAVDPPGGPFMTVGFEFSDGHGKYKVIGFSTMNEPLLIEIKEVS